MSMSLLLTWTLLLILIASPTFIVPATARQSYHGTTHNNNNNNNNNNKGNINILIAGSANMDTFLPINHLPSPGENLLLVPHHHPFDAPGGKGCNQAIASQLLSLSQNNQSTSRFIGRIGKDEAGQALCQILQSHNVDTAFLETVCASNQDHGQDQNGSIPTGRGYVFLEKESGKVSAVVSGGCNLYGWDGGGHGHGTNGHAKEQNLSNRMEEFFTPAENDATNNFYSCLLLQREVPEWVNLQFAKYAKSKGITVLQDVGGEDRIMHRDMMDCCDFLMPNVTELERLVRSLRSTEQNENPYYQHTTTRTSPPLPLDPNKDHDRIIEYAKLLQQNGAKHVLVTLGSGGSLLVPSEGRGDVIFQPPCDRVLDPNGNEVPVHIVDETGAGDCYRAAFAVALMEHNVGSTDGTRTDDGGGGDEDSIPLDAECMRTCMEFASAAGALAVTKEGAVPSIPTRQEVDAVLQRNDLLASGAVPTRGIPRGGDQGQGNDNDDDAFPYMFGSRLNSMKDRPELWSKPVDNVREWVKRQGTIQGLGCVDFNYPQHFHSWSAAEAKVALDDVGLVAGAVCLRYPSKFARGAMNHPDEELRREAIELTKQAAGVARELGCDEVVIWSAYDGYDYPFQVNYQEKWNQLVEAFQECCDEYPGIKWSLEFKPTDENTRFFTVPSTGAALMLVNEIDRPNMGLTMDVGHMLMAGENPAQSISMVGDKMFGIQLNDGYTRLAAEDGMMFGSIHPTMALEIMWQLQETNFAGHLYFDTFPQRTDPVKEAEYNIQSATRFWKAAKLLNKKGIKKIMENHDAVGAIEIINSVLKTVY